MYESMDGKQDREFTLYWQPLGTQMQLVDWSGALASCLLQDLASAHAVLWNYSEAVWWSYSCPELMDAPFHHSVTQSGQLS